MWILGASDPEMERIERLLRRAAQTVAYGLDETGKRAYPSSAYRISSVSDPEALRLAVQRGIVIRLVECGIAKEPEDKALRRVAEKKVAACVFDHHRPGDPGYGRPAHEFLAASSLGQVMAYLAEIGVHPDGTPCDEEDVRGVETDDEYLFQGGRWFLWVSREGGEGHYVLVPEDHVYAAAADHALSAAYRGECPGVDPDDLMRWRVSIRAAFLQVPEADILAAVESAMSELDMAPRILIGGVEVADLRGRSVPELPEASARRGMPFVSSMWERDGRMKVNLMSAPPEAVRAFLAGEGLAAELSDRYGDPARGFAGGYLRAGEGRR